jgi:hypothetical protein
MALGYLTEKKGIRNLQDFMLKIIVSIVSLYALWEMIVACHIFLASLKMNQDEDFLQENFADIMDEDEDFEIIGGKDLQCEEDFEIVEHPHNSEPSKQEVISQSQISLELGLQLLQNRDAQKESLGNILKRLFLTCMIIAIWLPLIKIITFILLRSVYSVIWALFR